MELKKKRKDITGTLSLTAVRFMFFFLVMVLILLLGKIFIEGIGVISPEFLIDEPKNNMTEGGIGPAIFGTIAVTLLMVLFAVPLGVCSAIYLNEYAKDTFFTRIIRTSINNLAGVPSIVFGLFGLGFFILFIGQSLDDVLQTGLLFGQPALLWASATLAVLVLPIVIVSTLEALNSVPKSHRDASYGLGATKWQTISKVILPAAFSGVSASIILGFGRAIGETMIVLMAAGNAANITSNIFLSVRTMTATIAAEMGEVSQGSDHYYSLFFIGIVLFTITFILNLIAEIIINKMRKKNTF